MYKRIHSILNLSVSITHCLYLNNKKDFNKIGIEKLKNQLHRSET